MLRATMLKYVLGFTIANLVDFIQVRSFPSEELDDPYTRQELLQKFRALIGEDHCLLTEAKHETHGPCLEWNYDEKDSKTS